jgi:hypothetical protein
MEQAIQIERVKGFRDYIDDVKSGTRICGAQNMWNMWGQPSITGWLKAAGVCFLP